MNDANRLIAERIMGWTLENRGGFPGLEYSQVPHWVNVGGDSVFPEFRWQPDRDPTQAYMVFMRLVEIGWVLEIRSPRPGDDQWWIRISRGDPADAPDVYQAEGAASTSPLAIVKAALTVAVRTGGI